MNDTTQWFSGKRNNVYIIITQDAILYTDKRSSLDKMLKINKRN